MSELPFDMASFYAQVRATAKERSALRQDLVRGLKDYYVAVYGYDRYGAETVLHLESRLGQPYIYGYAVIRILQDRRLSESVKEAASQLALDDIRYGSDGGLPFGLYGVLGFLAEHGALAPTDLRFALIASAGEYSPFLGLDKPQMLRFFRWLLRNGDLPMEERLFWAHSLVARHGDGNGAADLIGVILSHPEASIQQIREMCSAWINFRQPRLEIPLPIDGEPPRAKFVTEHMGFWITHSPSWSSASMLKLALLRLADIVDDPLALAREFMGYTGTHAEHAHSAVVDIISRHHQSMPQAALRELVERGISPFYSVSIRRRFYRLGTELLGSEYLNKASSDTASSVRQWAARQLQKQS